MNDVPARLKVKRGPNPEQEYILALVDVTIGRSSTNVVAIADPEISRRHACIRWADGGFVIEDWASTNGTFVNDRRIIGPTALYDGDEIRLGETILLQFLANHEDFHPGTDDQFADAADAVTVVESALNVWPVESEREVVPLDPAEEMRSDQFILPEQRAERSQCRRWVLGCGCGSLLFVFLCMSTVYFLDAYQQGRLLYCGPLRPFFEILLGPFGFSPICS